MGVAARSAATVDPLYGCMHMKKPLLACLASYLIATPVFSQQRPAPSREDTILLTIFLKHDQSKNLDQIQEIQKQQGFYRLAGEDGLGRIQDGILSNL